MKPLVIYHKDCMDGFCAAWVCHKALGLEYDPGIFIAQHYGDPLPDSVDNETDLYVVDFSLRGCLEEACNKANLVFVIDHHKSEEQILNSLDERFHNLRLIFDKEKSGAHLTWKFFYGEQEPNWLVKYTEDRDLWKWSLPDSRAINACLASYRPTFELWDTFSIIDKYDFIKQGEAILRYQEQVVEAQASKAKIVTFQGYQIPTLNATVLISEIGNRLCQEYPFSLTWFEREDGMRVYSLRGAGSIDVSLIAKQYGGGGHHDAAGFICACDILPIDSKIQGMI